MPVFAICIPCGSLSKSPEVVIPEDLQHEVRGHLVPGCLGPGVMLLELRVGKRREELIRVPDPTGSGHAI